MVLLLPRHDTHSAAVTSGFFPPNRECMLGPPGRAGATAPRPEAYRGAWATAAAPPHFAPRWPLRAPLHAVPAGPSEPLATSPGRPSPGPPDTPSQRLLTAPKRPLERRLGGSPVTPQPNFLKAGRMRLWPWEFVLWAAKQWN